MSKRRGTWPVETCPVCGTKWERYCRRDEWGFYYIRSDDQLEGALTLFCSDACSKAYAHMQFMDECRRVLASRTGQAFRLHDEGMPMGEALTSVGLNASNSWYSFELTHWRAIEWLRGHGWQLGA